MRDHDIIRKLDDFLKNETDDSKNVEIKSTIPIKDLPQDWRLVKLTEVAEYINGYPFSVKDWKRSGLPIIRIQNLNDPNAEFNYFDGEIDEKYIVNDGDILLSWSGSVGVYMWNRGKAVLNQHIFKVVPKHFVDRKFLYYAIFLAIQQLKERVHGSTMKHFRKRELSNTYILLPPIGEQRRIAEVLSTVDEAIRLVDESIAKTERLKKGLMQELLTKGIGHKEFKQTEIGKIPKEWKIVRLENITRKIIDSPHKMPKRISKGYPFVSVNYVLQFADYNFYIDPNMDGLEYIPRDQYEEFRKRFDVDKGDIIYTKWGTPGVAKLVNTSEKFIGSCSIALIKVKKEVIYPLFLVYMLNSSIVKCQIIPYSHTTTRTEIHIGHIKKIKVPLPLIQEQKKIAEILSTIDKRLEFERKKKAKLQKIKQGLMDLLLTGKIRVRVRK